MSSRSFGLLPGFFVSHGRSSPASCRLISSGSSVRKRMRPCSRTLSGRFSILRSRSELITVNLRRLRLTAGAEPASPYRFHCTAAWLSMYLRRSLPLTLVDPGVWERVETAAGKDFLEFVHQCVVHQAV